MTRDREWAIALAQKHNPFRMGAALISPDPPEWIIAAILEAAQSVPAIPCRHIEGEKCPSCSMPCVFEFHKDGLPLRYCDNCSEEWEFEDTFKARLAQSPATASETKEDKT